MAKQPSPEKRTDKAPVAPQDPAPSKASLLDGIDFADEEEPPEAPEPSSPIPDLKLSDSGPEPREEVEARALAAMAPGDRNALNQQAARAAIERHEREAALRSPSDRPDHFVPVLPTMSAEEEAAKLPKSFRVVRDARIVIGNQTAFLAAGRVLSANQYDVASLKKQGVELEVA